MKIGPFKVSVKVPERWGWRSVASNYEEWAAWDRLWRKRLGWRAGLAFWSETNTPGARVLLSRHWPHRLCWSWSIWVAKRRPGYDGPPRISLIAIRQYRMATLWLGWWRVDWHWQDSAHMAALGSYREGAPKIYWKHHLENAVPAGSA